MNYLKKTDWAILFLLGFVAAMQVLNTVSIHRLTMMIENFEPVVVVEMVKEEVPAPAPEPVVEEVPEPEPTPIRINCPLDDATQQMILDKCEEYGVDFAFTMALIFKESSFRPDADSGSSVGLMQINRCNHAWLSEELGLTDFFDPEQNVTAGLYMLRQLFEKYDDPHQVLMAYNMGEAGARKFWNDGVFSSKYSEGVMQTAGAYQEEINERMGW